MKYFSFLLLFILLCSCSGKQVIIKAQVKPNSIILADKLISKNDFESELEIVIKEKKELGFDKSELIIYVTADKKTSQIEMSEIEKSIRRSGLNRKYFWTE